MTKEIIISGFGGQGVLSMGKILAYSAMMEGKNVSWMPAYGPEQRGGTANVTIIISDEEISSPIVSQYDTAIVLNQPSLDKFEQAIKPGGTIIYDGSSGMQSPSRKDVSIYRNDAMDFASRSGNQKIFNMLILGGLISTSGIVSVDNVVKGLHKTLPIRHHKLIPMNEQAIRQGMELIHLESDGHTYEQPYVLFA